MSPPVRAAKTVIDLTPQEQMNYDFFMGMKKTSLYLSIFVAGLLLLPTVTFTYAEELPPSTEDKTMRPLRVVMPTLAEKMDMLMEMKASREGRLDDSQQRRKGTKLEMREERFEFEQRMNTMKDMRKKNFTMRIDTKIASISSRALARMSDSLTKMETILTKYKTRVAALKAASINTASVDAAIVDAEKAIANAKSALATQKENDYVLPVSEETSELKNQTGALLQEFRKDMLQLHALVVHAKQAVMKVAMEYQKIKKDAATPQASPSAQVTNAPTVIVTPVITVVPTVLPTLIPTNTITPTNVVQ